jgi:hypothetical protein
MRLAEGIRLAKTQLPIMQSIFIGQWDVLLRAFLSVALSRLYRLICWIEASKVAKCY